MPFKRIFDALRPATLRCCICLLLVAPQSLPAEAIGKGVVDEIIRSLSKHVRPVDENIAKRAGKNLSPETERSIKAMKAIREMKVDLDIEDAVSILWDAADDATKKRAELQASELKRDFKEETDRIKKEKKLSDECAEKVASAFIKTGCFCAKKKFKTGLWPTADASDKFAAEAANAAMQCVLLGLTHHISQVASADVARFAVPAMKVVGKAIGKAGTGEETSKPSGEMDKTELAALIHEFCKHE
jgi:hypothetical protein